MLRELRAEAEKGALRRVRFVMVYVAEAHAEDEWPISSGRYNAGRGPVRVTQPTSHEERVTLARRFVCDFDPLGDVFDEILVDDVDTGDEFERKFAPWPFRFFGVGAPRGCQGLLGSSDGVHKEEISRSIEYVAHPSAATYNLRKLREWVLQVHRE